MTTINQTYFANVETAIGIAKTGNHRRLEEYLKSLDFGAIKTMQLLVHLGADEELHYDCDPISIDGQRWGSQESETKELLGLGIETFVIDLQGGYNLFKQRENI